MGTNARVVRHSSEFGDWESFHREPHPSLAAYVTRYSGWWERTTFSRRREVASMSAVLIINIGNRLHVSEPNCPERLHSYHAFYAGPTSNYVVTESNGYGGGIQVDFTPVGGHLFLGSPAHELTNRVVECEDLFGADGRALVEQLEDTPDWETRFEIVEAAVLRRLAGSQLPSEAVGWAWNQLVKSRGGASIGGICQQLGWQPRQLIREFRREVGLAPKQAAQVLRFTHAVDLAQREKAVPWADVAAECGYYDQAHLVRAFRDFAGSTPTEFRARLVPQSGGLLDAEPGEGVSR